MQGYKIQSTLWGRVCQLCLLFNVLDSYIFNCNYSEVVPYKSHLKVTGGLNKLS